MKFMKKLWIEAQSYFLPIWQRPLPPELLAQHYYVKEKKSSRLGCVAGGLWVKTIVGGLQQPTVIPLLVHRKTSALQLCSPLGVRVEKQPCWTAATTDDHPPPPNP